MCKRLRAATPNKDGIDADSIARNIYIALVGFFEAWNGNTIAGG